jgi:hypothetical protein
MLAILFHIRKLNIGLDRRSLSCQYDGVFCTLAVFNLVGWYLSLGGTFYPTLESSALKTEEEGSSCKNLMSQMTVTMLLTDLRY